MIAGRNLLVEKARSDFHVNPRVRGRARKRGAAIGSCIARRSRAPLLRQDGPNRVISEQSTQSARAMAMGGSRSPYAFPADLASTSGLRLRGPDSQLAILFVACPPLAPAPKSAQPRSTRASIFAIAVPSSDRIYDAEAHEQERLQPASHHRRQSWQYAVPEDLGSYQFRFDGYTGLTTSDTGKQSQQHHQRLRRLGTRRGGYSAVANGAWFSVRVARVGRARRPL